MISIGRPAELKLLFALISKIRFFLFVTSLKSVQQKLSKAMLVWMLGLRTREVLEQERKSN